MDHLKPYLDYFAANPEWAIAIVFLIAFGEALLIIGLFVPSTAVLVGAGMLVGAGQLDFWAVFIATAIGAIAGDQVSFWAGRIFGDRLRYLWPLNKYPALVARGEDFVRSHGGKSIAVGRFVPGVKAVVPGIVGMLGMSQPFFLFVNVTSGLVWTAAHVFPGILIGQGLALAGELSGQLVVVLLVLLVLLAIAGWMMRLAAAGVSPYLHSVLQRISNWSRASENRSLNRFGRAIAPENPRAMAIVLFVVIAALCLFALVDLVTGLMVRKAVSNLDLSIATLMGEWRNAPADEIMIRLAMLADPIVLWTLGISVIVWLLVRRAWRAAGLALTIMICGEAVLKLFGLLIHRPAPVPDLLAANTTFPSSHTLMAGLVFGLIAVLASHAMGRWSKALVAATCGGLVVAIAFSRIYLGADWLSDALGGILIAAILAAVFGMVIEAIPSRRIKPLTLMAFCLLIFFGVGGVHISRKFDVAEQSYARPSPVQTVDAAAWTSGAWQNLPGRRIDLAGQPEEVFAIQWVGSLTRLESLLATQGFVAEPVWTWRDAISYLDVKGQLSALPPRPLLHQGLKAKLTMIRNASGNNGERDVVRIFKSQVAVQSAAATEPVYLLSLTREVQKPRFNLFSVPATRLQDDASIGAFIAKLTSLPAVHVMSQGSDPLKPRVILQPQL